MEKTKIEINENLINIDVKLLTNNSVSILSNSFFNDIEMFKSYQDDENDAVISKFEKCFYFKETYNFLKKILSNPIHDINKLNVRKQYIDKICDICNNTDKQYAIRYSLDVCKQHIADVRWLLSLDLQEKEFTNLCNLVFFNWIGFNKLNHSCSILTVTNIYNVFISPMLGILSPIIYFIIPFYYIRYKLHINISLQKYLTFIKNAILTSYKTALLSTDKRIKYFSFVSYIMSFCFYFHGIWTTVSNSKNVCNMISLLYKKVNSFATIVENILILNDKMKISDNPFFVNPSLHNFSGLERDTCVFGKHLKFFRYMNTHEIENTMHYLFVADMFVSIASNVNLNNCNKNTNYVSDSLPYLCLNNFYHICLNSKTAIRNSIQFDENCRSLIITGPNAAGKSTLIKSILVNILLAQTICVGAYDNMTFTPFMYINSQINIPDCKGTTSLFEAEMFRCKDILNRISILPGLAFSVMDELFNSTNFIEGIAGSYAIMKKLTEYPNVLNMVTTHLIYLTKLRKHNKSIETYKMCATVQNETITYSYKLQKGISNQYIALEILKQNNFDDSIIKTALEIKNKLLCV